MGFKIIKDRPRVEAGRWYPDKEKLPNVYLSLAFVPARASDEVQKNALRKIVQERDKIKDNDITGNYALAIAGDNFSFIWLSVIGWSGFEEGDKPYEFTPDNLQYLVRECFTETQRNDLLKEIGSLSYLSEVQQEPNPQT